MSQVYCKFLTLPKRDFFRNHMVDMVKDIGVFMGSMGAFRGLTGVKRDV